MRSARTFRDLDVYQLSREAAWNIFVITKNFPSEERFSLTDQMRRSSRAVGAMIACAWARRRYRGAFICKLDEALEEAMETQAWLDHALAACYINAEDFRKLDMSWQSIGGRLRVMMNCADLFCKVAPGQPHSRPLQAR